MSTSRWPGFYRLPVAERQRALAQRLELTDAEVAVLEGGSLHLDVADQMVENVIGIHAMPLGVGLNFLVNGRDYLVPMCVEEPSVIAAASNAAKMIRAGGGFVAETDESIMIGQVQLIGVADTAAAEQRIAERREALLQRCNELLPTLVALGGGARSVDVRVLESAEGSRPGSVVVHLGVDCRDAMGANMVNTLAEAIATELAELVGGRPGLRILTNLADRRLVRVRCSVPVDALSTDPIDGAALRDGIVSASRFAELDIYRAATHNKGIMNGVDAVALATGNDTRAVEAGAHAYAARDGRYRALATWRVGPTGALEGYLQMPLAVGTVGGTLRVHPGARLALRILRVGGARELASVMASAGLASNLAALRALAGEGIQRGHMSLHARSAAPHGR